MTSTEQERWARVKERLRAEVGEDIYSSWFAAHGARRHRRDTVRLSVPTRFLKSWIQSHYAEKAARLLAGRTTVASGASSSRCARPSAHLPPKTKPAEPAGELARDPRTARDRAAASRAARCPSQAVHEALGGSPLDPRLAFDTFVVGRSNTLAHAAAKQVAHGAARRRRSCSTRSTSTPASASARPICCSRSPGPATAAPSARCSISPPRSSCTASWPR